jgi:DNA sulfur modification protein DndD
MRDEAAEAPKVLKAAQAQLARALARRTQLEQELGELANKIENLPLLEIAERERNRRRIASMIDKEQQNLGGVRARIASLEEEKEATVKQLEELARRNKKTVKLLTKRQLLMGSIDYLKVVLEHYESDAREKIQDNVNKILDVVAHKDFRCQLNADFSVELILGERAMAKSGGENQLLSLAFIASLVNFAAERMNADDFILKPGTIAPLVLDAPLGQLDPSYQESVAAFLPKMAHQVVLLVTGAQGAERVLQALAPHIAAEYVLIQENRGPRGKRQPLRRAIRGAERDLILFGQQHTMTRIERVD